MADFSRECERTTRKIRQCYSCRNHILPGEKYTRWDGCVDGDFSSADFHTDCGAWEIAVNREINRCNFGDEWEALRVCVAEDPSVLEGAPEAVRARFAETTKQKET